MLTRASLRYYAASHAMVVVGVAAAVAVLAGALLVGSSVRHSLRDLALSRLGQTDLVVSSPTFFGASLADRLAAPAAPLVLLDGSVAAEASRRTAGGVAVYGIDARFAAFQGADGLDVTGRNAVISEALARELGAQAGDTVILRVARPSDIPRSTLQGRREATGERIRLTIARVLDRDAPAGEFSLSPAQGPVLALYASMARLQQDLDLGNRANVMLVQHADAGGDPAALVRTLVGPAATLDDLGLRLRAAPGGGTIVESRAGFVTDALAAEVTRVAAEGGRTTQPVLTYVANAIRIADREVPYSTVTAIDLPAAAAGAAPPIWLNEWAADDLKAAVGDAVTLDYYVWGDDDGLETRSAAFELRGVVPMTGPGGDRTLTPDYPGISDAADITSWDPPFPVELSRVRPRDEDYWDQWGAAPKAFVTLADGQRLWGSRFGRMSSLRLPGDAPLDAAAIDPAAAGFSIRHARAEALAASEGTTDFGEYFLYFSFFLVVSALLLAYLFFAVGLEQRTREVGLLAAVGFSPAQIRAAFVREAVILAGAGAAIGAAAAVGYGALIMYGLRTWWIGAVGTTRLELSIDPAALAAGVAGALGAALLSLWLGVRAMSRRSARSLLTGAADAGAEIPASPGAAGARRPSRGAVAIALTLVGAALIGAALAGALDQTAGFFGAGGAWLVAGLYAASAQLRRPAAAVMPASVVALGFRHTTAHPGRSILSLAMIAFACFVLVTVAAFRKDAGALSLDAASGTGGFSLMAESVAPLMFDPNTPQGRDGLGLAADDPALAGTRITRFRLRPGDEASCLTLYKPTSPRIIAPEAGFDRDPRFSFAASMAATPEEAANPWRLLDRTFEDGAVAAVADQTTLMYVLHLGVGDDFTFTPEGSAPVRLRIVGALADSVLQSELIIGEANFVRLFPRHEGYRVWMIDAPAGRTAEVTTHLEDRLSDFGFDVRDTRERWASYHEVENTYLGTFQALGALGLLLGTVGLGAVLARNVLERRREIGLLKAVGFGPGAVRVLVMSESLALVAGGLILGSATALVAILPAIVDRGQALPVLPLAGLLAAVVATGLAASLLAVRLALRTPVLTALKAE